MDSATHDFYRPLDEAALPAWLAAVPALGARLGAGPWRVAEVGDGNLNLVFLVDGAAGSVCVKQTLPYVRAAGPSWAMPLDRVFYEHEYYRRVAPHAAGLVPEILHYDPRMFCLVMETLSPHVILRRGLVDGRRYPCVAADIGRFVAQASFHTSALSRSLEAAQDERALFAGNQATLRISVELIFADPYRPMARNRWTPGLDDIAAAFRADTALKLAASRLCRHFLTCPQALLHGDLHSGSVMVTSTETRVIDPEFALVGPIGFDLGQFVANLLLAAIARDGDPWIIDQIPTVWHAFRDTFLALWRATEGADLFPAALFADRDGQRALEAERGAFLDSVLADVIGFAGAEIVRRILGFAHVMDFESIADIPTRAARERRALTLGRTLLLQPERFATIEALTFAARAA